MKPQPAPGNHERAWHPAWLEPDNAGSGSMASSVPALLVVVLVAMRGLMYHSSRYLCKDELLTRAIPRPPRGDNREQRSRVTVLAEGGHIAEIYDKAARSIRYGRRRGRRWNRRPSGLADAVIYGSGSDARLLAGIMGHSLCLDIFGPPSEEAHGGSDRAW